MEHMSSLNHSIPSELNDHYHNSYGGAIVPVHITSHQRHNSTGRKKSKVRLNDELIPKPTDINIGDKMIAIAIPKEHPYSSHISRFAMFPSFRSPDDLHTGVTAASQPFLNPLIPNSAPGVTVLSKAIGGQYRHEILETPMTSRKKAVMWPGEHGFLHHTKPLMGEKQVFYTTPPKTVPNSTVCGCELSLSERTSNMLKNLERSLWVTSYQMHYTGSGPANPLNIDDFKEKMRDLAGMNSHTAPLRERSYPMSVPSKPKQEWRRRPGSCVGRSTCSPTAAELLNPSPANIYQHRPQEIIVRHNKAPEEQNAEMSQDVLHKQQSEHKSKVQFDESLVQVSVPQSSQQANTDQLPDQYNCPPSHRETDREESSTKHSKEQHSCPTVAKDQVGIDSHTKVLSRAASESRELSCISNPCILPRPPVLPGILPVDRVGTVGREGAALSLLDLENSFSKSEAHRNFNSSITHTAVNLSDNVVTGKKHDFYGINSYYLHG